MALTDFLNAGTQMVSQFGGMALQNSYNKKAEKRQDEYNRGMADYMVGKQNQMNEQARLTNMKYWNDTNYSAQAEQMRKAGLNVGLMYDKGGMQASTGNAGGTATGASVQTHAPDAQSAMSGAGMALMNAAQIGLIKAQTENVNADTTNKIEGTAGISADSRNKSLNADITEATYQEQVNKLRSDAGKAYEEHQSAGLKFNIDYATAGDKIQQETYKTTTMGVELANKELGLQLTSAQIEETGKKIQKLAVEIANIPKLTEIQRQEMLTKRAQEEFNTSTPAEIKQWTDIGVTTMSALKGVPNKNITINKNRNYDNSTTNYE